ncbi:MAG: ATPase [bacterium]
MKKIVVDCGTSYTKIHYLESAARRIVPSHKIIKTGSKYDIAAATGHNAFPNAKKVVNELVALAEGALRLITEPDFTILDCGARDVKFVKVKNRKVAAMDWNTECGAFTGQVIDLLQRYFNLDSAKLPTPSQKIPVVCGVLGMTTMFDRISRGTPYPFAFAEFLRGIAHNCEALAGRPDRLYISGGLCLNKAFLNSFSCEVIPLGRFVLTEGLLGIIKT